MVAEIRKVKAEWQQKKNNGAQILLFGNVGKNDVSSQADNENVDYINYFWLEMTGYIIRDLTGMPRKIQ